jgi:predicted transcriptional regulator
MPEERTLLVSVKPHYAELLLSGVKTVELRRIKPNVSPGCDVLLYASSPTMQMVGTARVEGVDVGAPEEIWRRHSDATGIDRETFDTYFTGADTAVAITLSYARRLKDSVPLNELRQRIKGFRPPQSFRYLARTEAAAVV